jgi:hypothetical protein
MTRTCAQARRTRSRRQHAKDKTDYFSSVLELDEVRGLHGGSALDASSIRDILTGLRKTGITGNY